MDFTIVTVFLLMLISLACCVLIGIACYQLGKQKVSVVPGAPAPAPRHAPSKSQGPFVFSKSKEKLKPKYQDDEKAYRKEQEET